MSLGNVNFAYHSVFWSPIVHFLWVILKLLCNATFWLNIWGKWILLVFDLMSLQKLPIRLLRNDTGRDIVLIQRNGTGQDTEYTLIYHRRALYIFAHKQQLHVMIKHSIRAQKDRWNGMGLDIGRQVTMYLILWFKFSRFQTYSRGFIFALWNWL